MQTAALSTLQQLFVIAVFTISLASPVNGLLVVAAVAPLGHLIALASGTPRASLTDAIAVAFIAGWLLRRQPDRWGPRVAAPLAGWLLSTLVVASCAGAGCEADSLAAAARFVLGVALTAATVQLFRQRPGLSIDLPVAMAAGACVAVLYTVVDASTIDSPASAACFALAACLAIGMSARAAGGVRIMWATVSLWLIAGFVLAVARSSLVASGFGRTQPLIAATLRVLASRPLFGIGIGLDETTTPLFYSPWLSWHGGAGGTHNLLVIGAELGLVGLALWLIWIGAGLVTAARALALDRYDARLWGASTGVAAFVAALAVSRPLAFSETAFPFALQFGLMTALAGSTRLDTAPQPTRTTRWRVAVTTLGMVAVAAGALVSARRGPLEPPALQEVVGYASVLVPAEVMRVQLPLRVPSAAGGSPVSVEIKVDGGDSQATTVGDVWQTVDIVLPESSAGGRFHRIDIKTPAGIQVGDVEIVRRR